MSKKENQHFVPKFYLSRFSFNNNGKQIGLFNLESGFFKSDAKLKTQGSQKNFYGIDGVIEESLSQLENIYAQVFKEIINSNNLPKRNSFERYLLYQFAVIMSLRNPIQPKNLEVSFNTMADILKSKGPCNMNMLKSLEGTHQEWLNMGFRNILLCTNYCLDLEIKLFKNNTLSPFIISDNPVIRYNQYLERKKHPGGNSGYGSMGLQIFIPLDPNLILALYDPWAYKIGPRKQSTISIHDQNEIFQFNLLQFINCDRIVYFNHQMDENKILTLYEKSKRYNKANLPVTKEYPLMVHKFGKISKESVIVMSNTNCEIKLCIQAIKETSQAKSHKLDNKAVHLRKWATDLRNKYSS